MNFLRQSLRLPVTASKPLFSQSLKFSTTNVNKFARMTLLGRIGTDIVVREAPSGTQYVSYSLAVQTGREKTSWFNVAVFNDKQIEFMNNYVKKGSTVLVEASATMGEYVAEGSEKKQYRLNLFQDSITFTPSNRKPSEGAEEHSE